MTEDKNIIKGNRFVEVKAVRKNDFYVIMEVKSKDKKGKTSSKSTVASHYGSRLEAKNELFKMAEQMKAEIVYFGAFKNKRQ